MAEAATGIGSEQEPIGILLMGVTGHGKSGTGNSILGRNQFISRGGMSSVTKEHHVGYTEFEGRTLKVVDVPGFEDTDETSMENKVRLVCDALTQVLTRFPDGFHTVLLVISYRLRMTSDLKSSIISLVKIFDENAFKMNGILVITGGDMFKGDYEDADVRRWLEQDVNPENRWVLKACGDRCVLFDNLTTDQEEMRTQKLKLLSLIDEIARNNETKYVPQISKLTGVDRDKLLKAKEKAADIERIDCLIGMLKDNLYKMPRIRDPSLQVAKLSQLITDARFIKTTAKNLPLGVSEKLSTFIKKVEEVKLRNVMDSSIEMDLNDLINEMQQELTSRDHNSGEESWWQFISRNISAAVNSEVGQEVVTFFWNIAKDKVKEYFRQRRN